MLHKETLRALNSRQAKLAPHAYYTNMCTYSCDMLCAPLPESWDGMCG
jgi:hypothetical protein